MRSEKARRLSAIIWADRLRSAVPFILAFGFAACVGAFLAFDAKIAKQETVYGEVSGWSAKHRDDGSSSYIVWVHLPDGSTVMATGSPFNRAPTIGAPAELIKIQTATGRLRYMWVK
jgi:hypothetical protein